MLWEELLEGEGDKTEGETSIFLVLTVVIIWDAELSETNCVNIILAVISGTL